MSLILNKGYKNEIQPDQPHSPFQAYDPFRYFGGGPKEEGFFAHQLEK